MVRTSDEDDLEWLEWLITTSKSYKKRNGQEGLNFGLTWELFERGKMYLKIDDDVVCTRQLFLLSAYTIFLFTTHSHVRSRCSLTTLRSPSSSPRSAIIQNTYLSPPTASTIPRFLGSTTTSAPSIHISPISYHQQRISPPHGEHPSCQSGKRTPSSTGTNGSTLPTRTIAGSP